MKKKRKILLIALGVAAVCILLAWLGVCIATSHPAPAFDFDDPEPLWELAERTERYIIQSTDRGDRKSVV